ncbi:MAG: hypothetical protein E7435_01105 [Ruminococcaceae bacterium]|nr:hypothetical protein [Oscillospiraceae bacterium]
MAGLEEQLNAVLSNPQMMQQIMAMAQNFTPPQEAPPAPTPPAPALPSIDPAMLQKLSGLMTQGGVDKNQQHLLSALSPYINAHRITKLEKAMQAAKMARMATGLLGNLGQGR